MYYTTLMLEAWCLVRLAANRVASVRLLKPQAGGVSKREIRKSEEDFLHLPAQFRLVVDEQQMVLLLTGLLSKVLFKLCRMWQARNIP